MKQFIRNNTFETNSSSMHSLVISKESQLYTKDDLNLRYDVEYSLKYENGMFYLSTREDDMKFGRFPFSVLKDPIEKLRYYVAYYIGTKGDKSKIRTVKRFISKLLNIPYNKIDITSYNYRCDWCEFEYHSKYCKYGYVEHNDTGESVFEYIERNNIKLKDFVFNPNIIVVVDGDEYQEFKKLFQCGIIDTNNLQDISSGKYFWDSKSLKYTMFFLSDINNKRFEEELEDLKLLLKNNWYKYLIIEDFDNWDVETCNKDIKSVNFKNIIKVLKLAKDKGLELILELDTSSKDDYNEILSYFSKIILKTT